MEILTGFLIAFVIAITGVGAGTITAPVLMLFFGLPPAIAVGTALSFSTVVKIPATISYYKKDCIDKKVFLLMAGGGLPGVIAGTQFLSILTADKELKNIVMTIVGIIILISAALNIFLVRKKEEIHSSKKMLFLIPMATFFIGIEVGFSSAGAGALGTLLLLYATALLPAVIVGTDIAFGLLLSAVGGGLLISMGNVDVPVFIKLISGGILGSLIGVFTSVKVPPKPLRIALLLWLIFIGFQLLYRSLYR